MPVGVGGLAILSVGAFVTMKSIQYDPTGFRVQTLVIVTALDLFVVALGHLWDSPPSINTVMNSRLMYACCMAWGMVILHILSSRGGFPTEYIRLDA